MILDLDFFFAEESRGFSCLKETLVRNSLLNYFNEDDTVDGMPLACLLSIPVSF